MIMCGKFGDFCGSQETVFNAIEKTRYAIKMCEDRKTRKAFVKSLRKNKDEKSSYFNAFSLVEMLYDLDEKQEKCYTFLKRYVK